MKVIKWTVMGSVCALLLVACDEQKPADQPAAKLAASAPAAEAPKAEPKATAAPKPEAEKIAWKKVESEKHGIEFELPESLKQRDASEDYLLAWDDDKTAFFAAGVVENVEDADKHLETLAKQLDLTMIQHDPWKDDEHNGMKAKIASGKLKDAKGQEVKGHAAVMTTAEGKHVAFLLLYLASEEEAYKAHIEKLEESIKPIGKT